MVVYKVKAPAMPNVGGLVVGVAELSQQPASADDKSAAAPAPLAFGLLFAPRAGAKARLVAGQPGDASAVRAECAVVACASPPEEGSARRVYDIDVPDTEAARLPQALRDELAAGRAELRPLWDAGRAIPHVEEPAQGFGWVYSWAVVAVSPALSFAVQEWGVLRSHPCRVVAVHPRNRGIVMPVLECATVVEAKRVLAWLTEAESTPGFFRAEAYDALLHETSRPPVFGVPLKDACASEQVPPVIEACCAWLRAHGVGVQFIFRSTPLASDIAGLKADFNNGVTVNMEERDRDPHTVAGLLKAYLRDLPDPIIPPELCNIEAAPGNEIPKELLDGLAGITAESKNVLAELLPLMRDITLSESSKMNSQALATCIAPAIAGPRKEEPDLKQIGRSIDLVRRMIDNWDTVATAVMPSK